MLPATRKSAPSAIGGFGALDGAVHRASDPAAGQHAPGVGGRQVAAPGAARPARRGAAARSGRPLTMTAASGGCATASSSAAKSVSSRRGRRGGRAPRGRRRGPRRRAPRPARRSVGPADRGVGDREEPGERSHANRWPGRAPRPRVHSLAGIRALAGRLHLGDRDRGVARQPTISSRRRRPTTQARFAPAPARRVGPKQLHLVPVERGPRARRGIERADAPATPPAPASQSSRAAVAVDLGRERGAGIVLRHRRGARRARAGASASISASAPSVRQPLGQRAGGIVRPDRRRRPGAAPARCPCPASICMMLTPVLVVAGEDGRVDRRGAAQPRAAARRGR